MMEMTMSKEFLQEELQQATKKISRLVSEYDDGGCLHAMYGECSDWQSSSFNC
jgi:hypothetical protein